MDLVRVEVVRLHRVIIQHALIDRRIPQATNSSTLALPSRPRLNTRPRHTHLRQTSQAVARHLTQRRHSQHTT